MPDNPLIADEQPVIPTLGAGGIDAVARAYTAINNGDWTEGVLRTVNAVSKVGDILDDPLAGLAAAGFGWLMEHVSFLKEPLDALTGDQQAIDAMSATWSNIAKEIREAATDLEEAVAADTAPWHGPAIDVYRPFTAGQVALIQSVSVGAQTTSTAVGMAGAVLMGVRNTVRDLISQAVGELVAAALEWAAASVVTVGIATPGMVADIVRRATVWANRIATWTKKVADIFKKLREMLATAENGVDRVRNSIVKTLDSKGSSETLRSLAINVHKEVRFELAMHVDNTYNPDPAKKP